MSPDSSRPLRLGEILVARGLLTEPQVHEILDVQVTCGRPFGVLAETLFNVPAAEVESAWAAQLTMLADHIDISGVSIDNAALRLITRRQAWQFRVIPIACVEDIVTVATSQPYLPRAMRFISRCLDRPSDVVLTDEGQLGEALATWYPMGGLRPDQLGASPLDALQSN